MNFYPPKISGRFANPQNVGAAKDANAAGTGASFVCGAFIRITLRIEPETKQIADAKFKTNGCGYLIASAEVLTQKIIGKKLTGLHGTDKQFFDSEIEGELEKFPSNRAHCSETCLDALQSAFADFRALQIEEFTGEKALICTCFGVSEETIEKAIRENRFETVEEVTDACRAGGGCGSCQPLIQEIIDVELSFT